MPKLSLSKFVPRTRGNKNKNKNNSNKPKAIDTTTPAMKNDSDESIEVDYLKNTIYSYDSSNSPTDSPSNYSAGSTETNTSSQTISSRGSSRKNAAAILRRMASKLSPRVSKGSTGFMNEEEQKVPLLESRIATLVEELEEAKQENSSKDAQIRYLNILVQELKSQYTTKLESKDIELKRLQLELQVTQTLLDQTKLELVEVYEGQDTLLSDISTKASKELCQTSWWSPFFGHMNNTTTTTTIDDDELLN
jgi:hypothetical protein